VTQSIFTDKYERFRQLMVEARTAAGITQSQLAKKLNQPQSYVSKYERGERRLDLIEFIEVAAAIGMDVHKVLRKLQRARPAKRHRLA